MKIIIIITIILLSGVAFAAVDFSDTSSTFTKADLLETDITLNDADVKSTNISNGVVFVEVTIPVLKEKDGNYNVVNTDYEATFNIEVYNHCRTTLTKEECIAQVKEGIKMQTDSFKEDVKRQTEKIKKALKAQDFSAELSDLNIVNKDIQ